MRFRQLWCTLFTYTSLCLGNLYYVTDIIQIPYNVTYTYLREVSILLHIIQYVYYGMLNYTSLCASVVGIMRQRG